MTSSIIAIKGNYLDRLSDIFELFLYKDLNEDKAFTNVGNFHAYIEQNTLSLSEKNISLRGIWFDRVWTIILDPEGVDAIDDDALSALSSKLQSEVLTFTIQTTSNSYGYSKFNGKTERIFYVADGEIYDDISTPLPQEHGLNLNTQTAADDILKLANNFGIDMEARYIASFMVKQLWYSDDSTPESSRSNPPQKPWWKFW